MGLFPPLGRLLRPALPWLRLGAFMTGVCALLVALGVRRVRAEVVEAGMAFGDTLEGLGDVLPRPYVVNLNGERAFVASATLDESPSAALDRVEGLCRARDGGLVDSIAERARDAGFEPPAAGVALPVPGLLRHEGPKGGIVGCFAHDHALGLGEVASRLALVGKDGDLGHLGHLRYASARRTASGRTHLVVVWTNGSFVPGAAFPREGDAPGSDVVAVGKPEGSRRMLAATIEGAPYGVRVYHATNVAAPALVEGFERRLLEGGFTRDALSRDLGVRSYRRGAEELVVRGEASRHGGAVLSVVSNGARGGREAGLAP
jgi:hypothetical protein